MDEEITLDLRDFFNILRKRLKLIVGITVLCTLVSVILSFFVIKPTYQAKTSIVIGKTDSESTVDKSQYNYNDVMMFQKLVKTYAEIGKSRAVAENASARVKGVTADQIQKMVTVTPQADTQIIEFNIENNDPKQAYLIINAVSEAFIQEAKRIYPSGNIQVMDNAKTPEKPIKPKKALNVAIAFFIGLMASVGLAFVLEYMDSTIKTEDDISRYLDLPVIGIIPKNME
ncbi:YveK family protein [Clostridium magnum]|uniref:Capsular polysaccharide type 8 biosynthesis protein cap8A n=1 Tax=Clostridium magnum DSM 2767 TaxID=1121326 RepID=A0A162RCK8_9CLOT|nr:Wzz/FepE/Etk N-terminal domain-containing protein [Clostridium magnum]KZL89713.1 capsular polysaccharide type 8 biosynthesis protein cap8A [Clostridium magnum DSM 2767]SHH64575.1 Capsular polysaccharide biosynthesis protein [Clostridium magnum DSM 2767]